MTLRKKLDRCNDINDFLNQNKDRHIFKDKIKILNNTNKLNQSDLNIKSIKKSKKKIIDNTQSLKS